MPAVRLSRSLADNRIEPDLPTMPPIITTMMVIRMMTGTTIITITFTTDMGSTTANSFFLLTDLALTILATDLDCPLDCRFTATAVCLIQGPVIVPLTWRNPITATTRFRLHQ